MALIRYAAAAHLVVLSSACYAAEKPASAGSRAIAPTAFYIGVQGGMAWAQDKMTQYSTIMPLFRINMSSDTAFGGLHVGYQRMIDNFVVGLEADYDMGGSKAKGSYTDATPVTFSRTYQIDYRSTLRARFGYDFGTFAVYATGGGAMTNLKTTSAASSTTAVTSESNFGFGATLGAGVLYKLSRNWAAFSEYLYADFGHATAPSDAGLASGAKAQHRITETSIRAGAPYYFR